MNLILLLIIILVIINFKIVDLNIIEGYKQLDNVFFKIKLKNPTYLKLGLTNYNRDNILLVDQISKYFYLNYNAYNNTQAIIDDISKKNLDIGVCYERKEYPKNIKFVCKLLNEYFIIISDTKIDAIEKIIDINYNVYIGIQNEDPIITNLYIKLFEFYNIIDKKKNIFFIKDNLNNLFNKFNDGELNLICIISTEKNIYLKNLLKYKNFNILPLKNKKFKTIYGPLFDDNIKHINIKRNDYRITPTISIRKLILTHDKVQHNLIENLLENINKHSKMINTNMKPYVNEKYKRYLDIKSMVVCFKDIDISKGALNYYKKIGLITNNVKDIRKIYWKHDFGY